MNILLKWVFHFVRHLTLMGISHFLILCRLELYGWWGCVFRVYVHEGRVVLLCPLALALGHAYCHAPIFFLGVECDVRIVLLFLAVFEGKLSFFYTVMFFFHISLYFFYCADGVWHQGFWKAEWRISRPHCWNWLIKASWVLFWHLRLLVGCFLGTWRFGWVLLGT